MNKTDIESLKARAIVFYDGSCGLCQASVQFILRHNSKSNLYFTPLDSGVLQQLVPVAQLPTPLPDSVLFYEHNVLYTESEAALRIAYHLDFPFNLLSHFRIIPLSFRDFIYQLVAKHRYSVFGRAESCILPSPEQRARFI